jgi:hypothetical protein
MRGAVVVSTAATFSSDEVGRRATASVEEISAKDEEDAEDGTCSTTEGV